MSTFGNVSEVWLVTKRGVTIASSQTAAFYTSEHSAMAHAKENASREVTMEVYRCVLVADVVVDGPRIIDHRDTAVPG